MNANNGLTVFYILAGIASIIGVSSVPKDSRLLGVVIVASAVAIAALIYLYVAKGRAVTRGRKALIDTGNNLIESAKSCVVMFGGDMSWASDYSKAISGITQKSKRVDIIYPASDKSEIKVNVSILRAAGANLNSTQKDSGLRIMLIDPEDPVDAMLFIASRTLKGSSPAVAVGHRGSEDSYVYRCKIYNVKNDGLLVHAFIKAYKAIDGVHN